MPLVLHALVQTEAYSIGATAGCARVRPDQVERLVGLRMERQRRLFTDTDLEESVLDRPIGGTAIMREQLNHLVELSRWDNIEILVLPTSIGHHDGMEGSFYRAALRAGAVHRLCRVPGRCRVRAGSRSGGGVYFGRRSRCAPRRCCSPSPPRRSRRGATH